MKIGFFAARPQEALGQMGYILGKKDLDAYFFGEGFFQGEGYPSLDYERDIYGSLSTSSREIARARNLAKAKGVALGFGFYENDRGGIYNSYMVIDKKGEVIYLHRSLAPWPEEACPDYRVGKKLSSFLLEGKRFMLILGGELDMDSYLPYIIEYDDRVEAFIWASSSSEGKLSRSGLLAREVIHLGKAGVSRLRLGRVIEEDRDYLELMF